MRNKIRIFGALVAVVLCGCALLGGHGPRWGSPVLYVSPDGDDTHDGTDPEGALASLAAATEAIAEGGTIKMAAGWYQVKATAYITKSVTIVGGLSADFSDPVYAPGSLEAGGLSRLSAQDLFGEIIHVYAPAEGDPACVVELRGLDLTEGFNGLSAGGLVLDGGAVVRMTDCCFRYNTSYNSPSSVWAGPGSEVTAVSCSFRENYSWWPPTVIAADESSLVFEGCSFQQNSVRGTDPALAAVITLSTTAADTASFEDCVFSGNQGAPFTTVGGSRIDLGGNTGFAPPLDQVLAVFTGWTAGIAGATTVVQGPTIDGDETTMVMENAGGTVSVTTVTNGVTGEGTYTYTLDGYVSGAATYDGTLTATVTGLPGAPAIAYDGVLAVTGGEIHEIAFDYTFSGAAFTGTITINGVYVYDLEDDLGL